MDLRWWLVKRVTTFSAAQNVRTTVGLGRLQWKAREQREHLSLAAPTQIQNGRPV